MEALDRLTENDGRFDLLVTDVKMPMMDGIALAHEAGEQLAGPADPADDRLRRPARARGGSRRVIRDVVTKPFTLQQIREAVTDAAAVDGDAEAEKAA